MALRRWYSERVVLPSPSGPRVGAARVDVQGAFIVDVVEQDRAAFESSDERAHTVDLGGKLLAPAWVDGHTHIALSVLRAVSLEEMSGNVVESVYYRYESHLTPEDIRAFARMGAWECLLAGTAAVFEHYYAAEQVAEALLDVGITGVIAPTLQDLAGPGMADHDAQLEATERIHRSERLQAAGVFAALGPHATDTVSDGLFGRAADLSRALDIPVHMHVAQTIDEVERSFGRHGCTPVERLHRLGVLDVPRALLVHSLWVSEADLERLDPARHALGYCPWSQVQFGFPAHLRSWRGHGIPIAVGTDTGSSNDTMNVQQELRLVASGAAFETSHGAAHAAFRAEGTLAEARRVRESRAHATAEVRRLSESSALLPLITETPGTLHNSLKLGRIAPGWRANLAVYDLDHPAMWPGNAPLRALCWGDASAALHQLIVQGEPVGPPGVWRQELLASDRYQAHRLEASQRWAALRARVLS